MYGLVLDRRAVGCNNAGGKQTSVKISEWVTTRSFVNNPTLCVQNRIKYSEEVEVCTWPLLHRQNCTSCCLYKLLTFNFVKLLLLYIEIKVQTITDKIPCANQSRLLLKYLTPKISKQPQNDDSPPQTDQNFFTQTFLKLPLTYLLLSGFFIKLHACRSL